MRLADFYPIQGVELGQNEKINIKEHIQKKDKQDLHCLSNELSFQNSIRIFLLINLKKKKGYKGILDNKSKTRHETTNTLHKY